MGGPSDEQQLFRTGAKIVFPSESDVVRHQKRFGTWNALVVFERDDTAQGWPIEVSHPKCCRLNQRHSECSLAHVEAPACFPTYKNRLPTQLSLKISIWCLTLPELQDIYETLLYQDFPPKT